MVTPPPVPGDGQVRLYLYVSLRPEAGCAVTHGLTPSWRRFPGHHLAASRAHCWPFTVRPLRCAFGVYFASCVVSNNITVPLEANFTLTHTGVVAANCNL